MMQPVQPQPGWSLNNNHLQQAPVVSQTQIVVEQGPVHVKPAMRGWSTGLCGCCRDCAGCSAGLFCPFFYQFHLASRAGESCFIPLLPGAMVALRTKIRIQNSIRGSICNDCYILTCCGPCALCQMGRELDRLQN